METYIKQIESDYLKINTPQMIEVDRLMMEDYHIELIQMMENAGRCLAIVAREVFLEKDPHKKRIAILAGTGGNGGGALVCARRLHNWGSEVHVYMTNEEAKMTPIPGHQRKILKRMGVTIKSGNELPKHGEYDLIIDGVIGYSVKGDPYGLPMKMIHWINSRSEKVLSLDTPSGLDLTTGIVYNPSVKADATLTLAMPKQGLFGENAKENIGDLFLGDISVPLELYNEDTLKLKASNIFRYSDIVKI